MNSSDPISLWAHFHGASSHFPIALMFVSLLFDYGALIFRERVTGPDGVTRAVSRASWRTVAFWTLIVAAVLCVPTVFTGLTQQLGWFHVDPWEAKRLLLHRNIALASSILIVLLTLWRTLRRDRLKGAEFALYLVLLTAATAGVGFAGYLGAEVLQGN